MELNASNPEEPVYIGPGSGEYADVPVALIGVLIVSLFKETYLDLEMFR